MGEFGGTHMRVKWYIISINMAYDPGHRILMCWKLYGKSTF